MDSSADDQPRGLFHEQDSVYFSSFSCSRTQRRRLTHQSRRSTFCLEIDALNKILHDTEHSIDFSDDSDEGEESVHYDSNQDVEMIW